LRGGAAERAIHPGISWFATLSDFLLPLRALVSIVAVVLFEAAVEPRIELSHSKLAAALPGLARRQGALCFARCVVLIALVARCHCFLPRNQKTYAGCPGSELNP
jgi:hypothetical protein